MTKRAGMQPQLPDGSAPETGRTESEDPTTLRARIQELESLCAEVYVAAVALGLPQPLLDRLSTVAAHGTTSRAADVDPPARSAVASPPAGAEPTATAATEQSATIQIPHIRLTDRLGWRETSRAKAPPLDLRPLPERRRVMVVDDDPVILEVLERILKRENYELITAASGPEALQKAAEQSADLDLLITDYAMPVMTGGELAEKMRSRWPSIKVLYQTGFSEMLFEHRVELEDGSAFLEKPFTARGLCEAARLMLFGVINPQ